MIAARGVRLSDEQRLSWLRLIRSENVGPVTFRELVNRFGSAAAALDAVPDLARRGGRRIRITPIAEAERELRAAEASGTSFVALGEADYPPWLVHIDDAPPLLAIRGSAASLTQPMVGIVGSRNASIAGKRYAMQLALGLGQHGYGIASGLARGIDAAAHEAALGNGTVAVFAGGLDRLYPPENAALAARILDQGGAHVSEMPMGWEPRARDFPRRNRIVSGLSVGVIIVEAALQSGSLITARLAAEQNRLVFAVPGHPLDPRASGANRLIRDGAHIVTRVEDVLELLSPIRDHLPVGVEEPDSPSEPLIDHMGDDERARIVSVLGPTPVTVDEIIRFTGQRPAIIHLVLLELTLAGRLERHPGQRISLLQP